MKKLNGWKAAAVLLLTAASSQAQSDSKFYVELNGGGAFQNDVKIRNGADFGSGGDIKFDPGYRTGLALGYNWIPSFATELDASIIRNTISNVGADDLSTYGARADLKEIPLLINAVYTVPLHSAFKPYVGIGAGAAIDIFDGSNIPLSYFPGESTHYSSTDVAFAYQAMAGVKYALTDNLEVGLAYKFTGTTDNNWSDNNIHLQTDGAMTHTIQANFTYRF